MVALNHAATRQGRRRKESTMYCKICGDEKELTEVVRFWSPDDGWIAGRLCRGCYQACYGREPKPDDYAYDKRGDLFGNVDDAVDAIYG